MTETEAKAHRAQALPSIATDLPAETILERLTTASKRGRLPGFQRAQGNGDLFTVAAHGHPFDALVTASYDGGRVSFRSRMRRRLPVIFAVVLIATVWPGVHFMDQLIPGEWNWIPTWWWYIPITALPLPWVWKGLMQRSRRSCNEATMDAIRKIATELNGTIEDQPTPR